MEQTRRFPRIILNSYASLIEAQTKSEIFIYDFSQMGIGFITSKALTPKTFVSVIYQNEQGLFVRMKSYIKHCRLIKGNNFFVGVQFIAIESKNDRAV